MRQEIIGFYTQFILQPQLCKKYRNYINEIKKLQKKPPWKHKIHPVLFSLRLCKATERVAELVQ